MDLADTVELPIQRQADRALPGGGVAARGGDPEDQRWIRRQRTALQMASGLTLAAAFAGGALWYVPRIVSADQALLTGTVTSSAIVGLNFAAAGEISKVNVHPGQTVRKGQVLADEYAPDPRPVISADKAAIAADRAKISGIRSTAARPSRAGAASGQLAAGKARLAADRARLATDRATALATEIVAPAAGVVVAANGQPGQAVTSSGIRNYAGDVQQAPAIQSPQFSLLPEGPQPSYKSPPSVALPVIALRTSTHWQVTALVPESSVRRIKPGQQVTVSVPAARISRLPGRIGEVLPTPESTAQGTSYQVVVTVTRQAAPVPLNGMAADIRLGS